MALGEIFTAPVEAIAAGGAGLLRRQGQVVFMDFTAPGDLVRGRITGDHRSWARGELLELTAPSPLRVPPVCPLFGSCGGCSLQHLSYEAQVVQKSAILRDALVRIGGAAAPPEPRIRRSPAYEYRNRIQLHRSADGTAGFKGRGGGSVIPIRDCPVADPALRQALREGRVNPPPGRDRFSLYARGELFLQEGGPGLSQRNRRFRGALPLLGRDILLEAGLFFQSNGTLLEALIGDLQALAARADRSLPMADLYCGVGVFAAFLGDLFPGADMLEMNPAALDLARINAPGPGRRYFPLSDEAWAADMGEQGPPPYGFVLADPPRQGLSGGLRRWLVRRGPPLFAYVSCDPATLARDSRELLEGGYGLEELYYYDFYPQTAHIEALAVFSREGKPRAP